MVLNMLKNVITVVFILLATGSAGAVDWVMDFEENFAGARLDSTVWKRTTRGVADWQNTQSDDPRLVELRDGCLVLKGIVNDNPSDSASYITGGLVTEGLREFEPGRFEIRARLQSARGAWPAIWLLPSPSLGMKWPAGGEIDIMERLNHDGFVYQTVHTPYTLSGHESYPRNSTTALIRADEFNIYGVEVWPDRVTFTVNGRHTMSYPRLEPAVDGQYPFYDKWYILIDMQLGGSWVGEVDPAELPVEMEVDWVRHYRPATPAVKH